MITVTGTGKDITEVRVRRDGKLLILSPQSEPDVLFAVLKEFATYIIRKR